jgi:acetyl-CoA carboxylase biotin carboxyl carrier protein
MTDDKQMIESTWAEARDLVRRLEGTSVQRFAVKAGDYEIEIERGAPTISGHLAPGAGGLGVAPSARGASGAFAAIGGDEPPDNRVPVLSPLVGTFYRAAQPGAKEFANEGDVVDIGQTVCIVEAMKLMNEVAAGDAGKIVEICVENGEPVEFEQVLMYLEPGE